MPKPISNPLPAYGSPEWKAERAKMVGTPEWRAANRLATLDESVKFKTDEAIRDWINYEIFQGKNRPTADQIAAKRAELEPQFGKTLSPSADPQAQKMMMGADILWRINDQGEKEFYYGANPLRQDAPHSELYNRLLQSGGMKEGVPIDPWSLGGKFNPGPTIPQPNYQMPSTVTPPANKSPAVNTANLTQAYQNQNQIAAPSNPTIQLPQQFQQNFNATPSITPPTGTQGIKMPKFNRNAGFSTNWSDLFSVAHNRYTR